MQPETDEFLEYFLAHQVELRAFVYAIVRDREASKDVFQDVSQALWQSFDQFDRSRSFIAWARGVARNKILHQWRRDKKSPVLLEPEAVEAVCEAYNETESDSSLMSKALSHCVEALPRNSRRLLEWRYEGGLRLKEIADRLRTSLDAVNKALGRLRLNLQACIEKTMRAMET